MHSVPIETLREKRAIYQQGVEQIDARLAQLRAEAEKLARDRLATLGAIQCIEILLTPAEAASATPAASVASAESAASAMPAVAVG